MFDLWCIVLYVEEKCVLNNSQKLIDPIIVLMHEFLRITITKHIFSVNNVKQHSL